MANLRIRECGIPGKLDAILIENFVVNRGFTQLLGFVFGGVRGGTHSNTQLFLKKDVFGPCR